MTHTCQYSGHKAFTIPGPLHIQMPEEGGQRTEIQPASLAAFGVYLYFGLLYKFWCVLVSPLVPVLAYVYVCIQHSVPAMAPFWDPSGLEVSVSGYHFLSSAAQREGIDWRTDGPLVGIKVAVGTEGWATSWEESHVHASMMVTKNTPRGAKTI